MRNIVLLACAAVGAAACTMNEPTEADRTAREAALSTALRDYEPAGPPVDCVQMRQLGGNKSAGDAIVFEGTTRERLWVNRPAGGGAGISDPARGPPTPAPSTMGMSGVSHSMVSVSTPTPLWIPPVLSVNERFPGSSRPSWTT